jgi:hypothetical protein
MPYEGPGIYRHYKGPIYQVHGLSIRESSKSDPNFNARNSELHEVVYEPHENHARASALYHSPVRFWTRELDDFDATVVHESVEQPRFIKLD